MIHTPILKVSESGVSMTLLARRFDIRTAAVSKSVKRGADNANETGRGGCLWLISLGRPHGLVSKACTIKLQRLKE